MAGELGEHAGHLLSIMFVLAALIASVSMLLTFAATEISAAITMKACRLLRLACVDAIGLLELIVRFEARLMPIAILISR